MVRVDTWARRRISRISLFQRGGGRNPDEQHVGVVPGHRMARLDLGEPGQLLGRVVGLPGVQRG